MAEGAGNKNKKQKGKREKEISENTRSIGEETRKLGHRRVANKRRSERESVQAQPGKRYSLPGRDEEFG
jgi:hypothetical protein